MKLAIRFEETDRSALREGDEGGEDGEDDDVWRAPATAREASLRRARTVAAINANPRRRDDMSARSTTPILLAAAIEGAVEREMSLRGSTNRHES